MNETIEGRLFRVIAVQQGVPVESVGLDTPFIELGVDSLDAINIVFAAEEEFGVTLPDKQLVSVRTPREFLQVLCLRLTPPMDF
ncbi:MAG: acyl carrier protein [Bryobacteraceae bacterium]